MQLKQHYVEFGILCNLVPPAGSVCKKRVFLLFSINAKTTITVITQYHLIISPTIISPGSNCRDINIQTKHKEM